MLKEIVYDRETRGYRAELDGRLIGFYPNFHTAEVTLNQVVYNMLIDGDFHTAEELDGDPPAPPDPPIDIPEEPQPPTPGGPPPPEWRDLLTDTLNVLDMALGYTSGATSIVGELRRVRARIDHTCTSY